jgi:plastocyanin
MTNTLSTILCLNLAAAALASAGQHEIVQKDRAFSRTELTIKAGDSIVFKNMDEVTHNVLSVSPGMEFDIRRQAPGGSSSYLF